MAKTARNSKPRKGDKNMYDSKTVDRLLEWVRKNYGDQVCSAVKGELNKEPCNTKAKLFKKLYQVLGTQEVKRMKHTVDFGDIRYNSI